MSETISDRLLVWESGIKVGYGGREVAVAEIAPHTHR